MPGAPERVASPVRVQHLMTKTVLSCRPEESLAVAARLLWTGDCGALPVVAGDERRVMGMLTDRDICMAAWIQGRALSEIPVEVAMAPDVVTCRPEDDVVDVLARLREHHVRRLPVVDDANQLLGIVSLVDIARAAEEAGLLLTRGEVATTLVAISAPPPDWSPC